MVLKDGKSSMMAEAPRRRCARGRSGRGKGGVLAVAAACCSSECGQWQQQASHSPHHSHHAQRSDGLPLYPHHPLRLRLRALGDIGNVGGVTTRSQAAKDKVRERLNFIFCRVAAAPCFLPLSVPAAPLDSLPYRPP